MFKDDEMLKKEAADIREMEDKFESERDAQMADEALKARIDKKYNQMMADLAQGKVPPQKYQMHEVFHMTMDELESLPKESAAFKTLWEKKWELSQARKEAEDKWAKLKALERTTGRKDIDVLNFDKVEAGLTQDEMREYMQRVAQGMNPEEEQEKLTPKTEAKTLKEVEESQAEEPEESEEQEDEPEGEPEPDDRNTEYQI